MARSLFSFLRLALVAFVCLTAIVGCASKNTGGDPLDIYTPDEDEVFDVDYVARDDGQPLSKAESKAFRTLGFLDKDMPTEDSQVVELEFKYFVHKNRKTFQYYVDRSNRYLPYMRKVFRERGIPEELVYVAIAESGGNPIARSRVGAMGLWQFMPYTGKVYGLKVNSWIDERRDPYKATYAASDYFLKLYGDFKDWHLAMAAYNAGEGKIGRAISGTGATSFFDLCRLNGKLSSKLQLREETMRYVPRIIAITKIMRSLTNLGFTQPSSKASYDLSPVTVHPGTNLSALARTTGVTWDEFVGMNPAYSRTASPPSIETTAYLPPDKIAKAETWLASKESRSFVGWKEHRIKRRESLSTIARRYKVSIAAIREANGFSSLPRVGTTIVIPSSSRNVEPIYAARADKSDLASRSKGKYAVRSGDTLFSLAQKWGTTVDSIRRANRMGKSSALSIGQRLNIPANSTSVGTSQRKNSSSSKKRSFKSSKQVTAQAPNTANGASGGYVIKAGDTVGSISLATGVPSKEIYKANNLTSKSVLRVGRTLILPKKRGGKKALEEKSVTANSSSSAKPSSSKAKTKAKIAVVAKGDTLYSIARKNDLTVDALRKANNLKKNAVIKLGQILKLPQ